METLTEAQQELYDWLVEYINQHHYAPSIRQMMRAMNLKSPAPVQSRLDHLREKGYITWSDGKARTYRILRSQIETQPSSSVPILGAIAAGCMVEPYTDSVEKLDLANALPPKTYALRVMGDSMIEDHIADGDLVILCPVAEPDKVKNGTIVAARVEGHGTTLKRFYRKSDRVILKPANAKYQPIEAPAEEVQLQGTLVGVWRNY